MTILCTSDLHFSSNPRDEYRHGFVKTLRKMITDHKVEKLLILGDLTETKDRHDAELVNRVVGHIDRLAQDVDELILLRGNHDWLNDPSMPFFKFLGRLPNVRWINKPTWIEHRIDEAYGMLFLPNTTDYKTDWAEYIENRFTGCDFVFCHNTFTGTRVNGRELPGIPTDIFPDDLIVISGDVHTPQKVGPVMYVGAPYTCDFGDDYEPRVLLIDADGITALACRGPMKRLVEIDSLDELDTFTWPPLTEGDVVKVRVAIIRAQVPQWAEIRQKVRAWGEDKGYLVHVVQPVITDDGRRLDTAKRRHLSRTDGQLFSEYCKRMGIDEKTAQVGRKLMGE